MKNNPTIKKTKLHIMIIDDDMILILSIKKMLRESNVNWKVDFFTDARVAMFCLNKSKYDVIISDCNLPHMDGITFFNIVKKDFPELIRILFSGNIIDDTQLYSKKVVHRFIKKPFSIEQLKSAINETYTEKQNYFSM